MIDAWNHFLESLATGGGRIFILLVCSAALLIVVLNGQPNDVILATFSAFTGALLAVLSGEKRLNGKPPEPPSGA